MAKASAFLICLFLLLPVTLGMESVPTNAEPNQQQELIKVFYQDYKSMGEKPSNVFTACSSDGAVANTTVAYNGSIGDLEYKTVNGQVGMLFISGLIPAVETRYTLDIGFDTTNYSGSSVTIELGGVLINIFETTEKFYLRGQHFDADGALIADFKWEMDKGQNDVKIGVWTNTTSNTAVISCNDFSSSLPHIRQGERDQKGGFDFTPLWMMCSSSTGNSLNDSTTLHVKSLAQEVVSKGPVSPIGSTNFQALGFDGPHPYDKIRKGFDLLSSLNSTPTLFVDVDYVKNATYLEYLNHLVHDKNWELGIHFTNSLSNQSTDEAFLEMNTEFQQIKSDFNGTVPVTWCSLGNHDNATHSIYAWTALDLLNRNQLVAYQPSCSYSLCNSSWDLWISQAKAGIACPPLYTHETDLNNAISSSIDWSKFDQWVQVLNGSGIRIVGYQEWYSIEENQSRPTRKFYNRTTPTSNLRCTPTVSQATCPWRHPLLV